MDRPSLAVLIPSYNHGRYIAQTLRSVFRQSRAPDEVFVIDDGSTDDSVAVIERAFADAGSIRCTLKVRDNCGISVTRDELFRSVTTDYVAFLDSDDFYAPTRFERMLAVAPDKGSFFGISAVDFFGERDDTDADKFRDSYRMMLYQGASFPCAGFALLRSNFSISASNFILSRDVYEAVGGFDARIKICQDWDFAISALRYCEPTFVPEPLLTYRLHDRNTSKNARITAAHELNWVIEKFCDWAPQATLNRLAPTPRNWPKFFRMYLAVCHEIAGRPVKERFPTELLAITCSDAGHPSDSEAMRRLLAAARASELSDELPVSELARRCHEAWSRKS